MRTIERMNVCKQANGRIVYAIHKFYMILYWNLYERGRDNGWIFCVNWFSLKTQEQTDLRKKHTETNRGHIWFDLIFISTQFFDAFSQFHFQFILEMLNLFQCTKCINLRAVMWIVIAFINSAAARCVRIFQMWRNTLCQPSQCRASEIVLFPFGGLSRRLVDQHGIYIQLQREIKRTCFENLEKMCKNEWESYRLAVRVLSRRLDC